jgi:hypothetical protein
MRRRIHACHMRRRIHTLTHAQYRIVCFVQGLSVGGGMVGYRVDACHMRRRIHTLTHGWVGGWVGVEG